MNFLQDIKTAVKLTGEIRKARKSGAKVEVRQTWTVPCITPGPAYANTIEWGQSWQVSREADLTVREIFKSLPYETQRWLEFSPKKPGEWVERARLWQQHLKPVLPPKMYHRLMMQFIGWYVHCQRQRLEAKV